jgi:hypothetical protein
MSGKVDFAFGVTLVGLLSALTGCARHTQIPSYTQTSQAGDDKPSSTTNGNSTTNATRSTQELVPVSAVGVTEPKEPAPTAEPSATTVRPSNDADDPRAVIDWLLDGSRRGR